MTTPTEAQEAGGVPDLVTLIIRDVGELPDRTSPADWPEAMLVTAYELSTILVGRLAAAERRARMSGPLWEALHKYANKHLLANTPEGMAVVREMAKLERPNAG